MLINLTPLQPEIEMLMKMLGFKQNEIDNNTDDLPF